VWLCFQIAHFYRLFQECLHLIWRPTSMSIPPKQKTWLCPCPRPTRNHELWPMTLISQPDHDYDKLNQCEKYLGQRLKVISFKSYCLDTHTHTHNDQVLSMDHQTGLYKSWYKHEQQLSSCIEDRSKWRRFQQSLESSRHQARMHIFLNL